MQDWKNKPEILGNRELAEKYLSVLPSNTPDGFRIFRSPSGIDPCTRCVAEVIPAEEEIRGEHLRVTVVNPHFSVGYFRVPVIPIPYDATRVFAMPPYCIGVDEKHHPIVSLVYRQKEF